MTTTQQRPWENVFDVARDTSGVASTHTDVHDCASIDCNQRAPSMSKNTTNVPKSDKLFANEYEGIYIDGHETVPSYNGDTAFEVDDTS